MKRRFFISVIVIVLAVALAWVLIYRPQTSNQHSANVTPGSTPAIHFISQAEVEAVNKAQTAERERQKAYSLKIETDKNFAESELQQLITDNPRAKRMSQLVKAANLPIQFYGTIVDNNNNPISDVKIKYSIAPAFGIGQPNHGVTTSDAEGTYVIKGEGDIVSLNSFHKLGYQFLANPQYFFSAIESGRPNTWRDHVVTNPYKTVGQLK